MWSCQTPKQPIFAGMTFMFLFLPSPQMMNIYTDKGSASVLNIFWGFIFLIGGILAIVFKESLGWVENENDTIELLFVLAPLGVYSLICGLGNIGKIKSKERLDTPEKLKYSLKLLCTRKILFYPVLFFLSPLITLLIYLRAIFRHNLIFYNDYTECKYIESCTETSPQLCLQLYILLRTFDDKPSVALWLSVITGILSVGIPPSAKFLHYSTQPYRLFNYVKYYPIFFFNTVFKVFSWSTIFIHFYLFYGALIMIAQALVLTLLNYLCMKIWYEELEKEKSDRTDYRLQVGEMAVQNFLTIPNLGSTKAARFCRKFSFYGSLIFNIILILILVPLEGLEQFDHAYECGIFSCEKKKDFIYFNQVVAVIISFGLSGLVLDLIYAKCTAAVFNIPVVTSDIYANDISRILNGPKKVHYKNSRDESVIYYEE